MSDEAFAMDTLGTRTFSHRLQETLARVFWKFQRVIADPRLFNDRWIIPHAPTGALVAACHYRLLPPMRTAVTLLGLWQWQRLLAFIKAGKHPLFIGLSDYLNHPERRQAYAKEHGARQLMEIINERGMLNHLRDSELWNGSRLLIQFGFFDAALAFRLAALGRLLGSSATSELLRQQVTLELAGMTAGDIQSLAEDYRLQEPQTVMAAHKQGQHFSQEEILKVYRQASEGWLQATGRLIPPELLRKVLQLRDRIPHLRNQQILLIGPSVRKSEPVSPTWPDQVMRIGYLGTRSAVDNDEWPTHLTFYRDHKLSGYSTESLGKLFAERTVILSNLRSGTLAKIPLLPTLYGSRFSGPVLCGNEPNAGPEVLMCLLEAGAKQVHITHMDLMLNDAYPPGYIKNNAEKRVLQDGTSREAEVKCRSMALMHPPSAQFAAMHLFWQRGRVTGDRFLTDVMGTSAREYGKKLEAHYHPLMDVD